MTSSNQHDLTPGRTVAIIRTGRRTDAPDLEWLFTCWCWEAGYRDWEDGVRGLARVLRGLERIGFVARARFRERAHRHTFVLTDEGREALEVFARIQQRESER